MKRFIARCRGDWERMLFWGCALLLACVLTAMLTHLWHDAPQRLQPTSSVPRRSSLLNEETCFRFLEEHAQPGSRNPFSFTHRVPLRPPEPTATAEPSQPGETAKGSAPAPPTGQSNGSAPARHTPLRPHDATAPRSAVAVAGPVASGSVESAAPARTVAVTFRGTLKASNGQTVAFVKAVDSAGSAPILRPVGVGGSIADLVITQVDGERLGLRTPKGETASLPVGQPRQFRMP